MTKVLARMAFARFGVRRFEKEINSLLGDGWILDSIQVHTLMFRVAMVAVLYKEDDE